MRILYHTWLCPFSRRIRLQLMEKKLDFSMEWERIWDKRPQFLNMNPAGLTPVLVDLGGAVVVESYAIGEYLEECYQDRPLLGTTPTEKGEVRRLIHWFENKFYHEATHNLVFQKFFKTKYGLGGPDPRCIRDGQGSLGNHLEYIGWLTDHRRWLAGEHLTLADFAAAAQLSCIDYLGDVRWEKFPTAKDWYVRVKSRPSFRSLLQERIPGIAPAPHYHDLDF